MDRALSHSIRSLYLYIDVGREIDLVKIKNQAVIGFCFDKGSHLVEDARTIPALS